MKKLDQEYFNWLYGRMCRNRFADDISYEELFAYLHSVEFVYHNKFDQNRASDGIDLRYRYALIREEHGMERRLTGPCSVLEMIVALAIRCEENIMDDPSYGDRTAQWFWGMLVSLGIGSMDNARFDRDYVQFVIDRFHHRKYEPNGKGGLFTIKNCSRDLRKVEIWTQMCWYLNTII